MVDSNIPEAVKIALDIAKDSGSTVDTLWGMYSAVALALLGYVVGSKTPVPGRGKLGLALGFAVFAAGNAGSLWHAQQRGQAASMVIKAFCDSHPSDTVTPVLQGIYFSPPGTVMGFQIFFTLCALAAVYAAHRHDVRTSAVQSRDLSD